MTTAVFPENPVAKKKSRSAPLPDPSPSFERIEFQAPVGFTASLDRARRERGLSRAAYIRQAVLLLMQQDKRGQS